MSQKSCFSRESAFQRPHVFRIRHELREELKKDQPDLKKLKSVKRSLLETNDEYINNGGVSLLRSSTQFGRSVTEIENQINKLELRENPIFFDSLEGLSDFSAKSVVLSFEERGREYLVYGCLKSFEKNSLLRTAKSHVWQI